MASGEYSALCTVLLMQDLKNILDSSDFNHMPLVRQSKNYARMSIYFPVSTTVGWIETFALRFEPVYHSLLDRIRRGAIAYSDDTSIPVMTEDKKNATHRGTMWLYGNGKDAVYFEYLSLTCSHC